jgi:hypothetical protein
MEISLKPFEIEEYRKRVREMADDQLTREGKLLRNLVYPKMVSVTKSAFEIQYDICREEWRRRHKKTF